MDRISSDMAAKHRLSDADGSGTDIGDTLHGEILSRVEHLSNNVTGTVQSEDTKTEEAYIMTKLNELKPLLQKQLYLEKVQKAKRVGPQYLWQSSLPEIRRELLPFTRALNALLDSEEQDRETADAAFIQASERLIDACKVAGHLKPFAEYIDPRGVGDACKAEMPCWNGKTPLVPPCPGRLLCEEAPPEPPTPPDVPEDAFLEMGRRGERSRAERERRDAILAECYNPSKQPKPDPAEQAAIEIAERMEEDERFDMIMGRRAAMRQAKE